MPTPSTYLLSSPPPPGPRLLGIPQPDPLDPAALGADIVDPEGDDTARLLVPEGGSELGLGPDRLALDR